MTTSRQVLTATCRKRLDAPDEDISNRHRGGRRLCLMTRVNDECPPPRPRTYIFFYFQYLKKTTILRLCLRHFFNLCCCDLSWPSQPSRPCALGLYDGVSIGVGSRVKPPRQKFFLGPDSGISKHSSSFSQCIHVNRRNMQDR